MISQLAGFANKRLQLPSHSTFQSTSGRVLH